MHAYLIMAHDKIALLQQLLDCIDDERNDIYVHIDKKFGVLPALAVHRSGLYVLENRVDVRWGDVSQIEAEMRLLESALSANKPYSYLHLLSGVDLPLKPQDYIHAFFAQNNGKEFIGFSDVDITPEIARRAMRYHLFPRQFRSKNAFIRVVRAGFLRIQEYLGIRRNKDINFKKGGQWFSITPALASLYLSKKVQLKKIFGHTFCSDEMAIQTVAWNSGFKEHLYDISTEDTGHMRCINWQNGKLIDWAADDYSRLASCEALFARKFNLDDPSFIGKIAALSKSGR